MATDPTKKTDDEENSPFEVVRTAVSNTDDSSIPSMTFRSHVLGIFFVCLISFVNQFYWERDNPIALNLLIVQLLCYPMGVAMAWVLPTRTWNLFGYQWSMNPGPFNIKEHVLVSLMSNASAFMALTVDIFAVLRLYYNPSFPLWAALLLLLSGQLFAYALAGLSRTLLVLPAPMIWPSSLINASLFRTFHEQQDDISLLTGMSRTQFFWVCFGFSFVWYFVPGYLVQVLSTISILCLVAPNNHLANMIGDGKQGLGILSFSLDWSVFSNAFLLSPIATPFWAACNLFLGFVLVFWIALPAAYFNNLWDSATLPLYSINVYTTNSTEYNITRVMRNGVFDSQAYEEYSPLRMSLEFSWVYGIGFAALMSILVHIVLYNGKEIITRVRETKSKHDDIHGKLMTYYPPVKAWWYLVLLVASSAVGIAVGIGAQIGVPWWGYLLSFAIAIVLVIPVGIIQAISNRQPGLSLVAELLSGIVLQGIPTGYSILKLYGHGSLAQALSYAQDMKLAHYMKIPPRQVLLYQLIGIVVSVIVQTCLFFWLIDKIPHMCRPEGFPWVCRSTNLVYSASIIWNLIGPLKVFGEGSPYSPLLWGFLFGLILPIPVYFLQRRFPNHTWLKHIYIPVILSGIVGLPPMPPVDFPMWFLFGFIFNFVIHRYWNAWWKKYNFTVSAGLDSGLALSGILQFLALTQNGVKIDWWGNRVDQQCTLSKKPWLSP
ncbi:OPT superfamily oligopeptide transporter [Coemansia reversa NRRL 1564]|uniref:OPT superfamily oligopeptide transporter n=1 Tax=Coemansia reversa (strain ATCC 12441 / NRRL 1564) TaxID=763665 RepID=A0A2G5BK60_COERN|nr:OPT superfamily oligopeptide transporter [Coemansia reversa NRRL 1564]|eukprot:PIA19398.1 OPT superfamily oligopeptide transporter [Coemansia reversa NRRL 1564]